MVNRTSLIIPVYNEMKKGRLPQMIQSIKNQTITPGEVIFVDGHSSDGTNEYLKKISNKSNGLIKLISDDGNISTARNTGVTKSVGNILLFTDAGCILPNNWVEKMSYKFLLSNNVNVVAGGYVADYDKDSKLDEAIGTTIIKKMDRWDHKTFLPSGRSLALRKEVFIKVGGYPEHLDIGEDTEFDLRLKDAGYTFLLQTEAPVKWSMGGLVGTFIKKMFNYGAGDGQNNRMVFDRGWIALSFLFINIIILIRPKQLGILLLFYILSEGLYLSYVNKRWGLLKEYILIGWLKRYAYLTGFLYGMTFKRWLND